MHDRTLPRASAVSVRDRRTMSRHLLRRRVGASPVWHAAILRDPGPGSPSGAPGHSIGARLPVPNLSFCLSKKMTETVRDRFRIDSRTPTSASAVLFAGDLVSRCNRTATICSGHGATGRPIVSAILTGGRYRISRWRRLTQGRWKRSLIRRPGIRCASTPARRHHSRAGAHRCESARRGWW
jgi:hypothetical protein